MTASTTPTAPALAGPSAASELQAAIRATGLAALEPHEHPHGRMARLGYGYGPQDPGYVAPDVMPALRRLAGQLGYRVQFGDTGSSKTLGHTIGATIPEFMNRMLGGRPARAFTITLQPGMSPASNARVLCHELGHTVLGHVPRTQDKAMEIVLERLSTAPSADDEDPSAEVAVELAAGAVCKLAGIGSGIASPYYLASRLQGLAAPGVQWAALLAARTIWAALRPEAAE